MPRRTVVRPGAIVTLALCASAIALAPRLHAQSSAASMTHAAYIAPVGSNLVTVEARDFALSRTFSPGHTTRRGSPHRARRSAA